MSSGGHFSRSSWFPLKLHSELGKTQRSPPISPRISKALEVCVDNVESALNACQGGASRLELCSSLNLGGLTPSLGLFRVVRQSIPANCPVFVMIRPKPGESFVHDEHDVKVMAEDIGIFKENGADGFVFGCLDSSRRIDERTCSQLLKAAGGLPCTFHRAFDVVLNPEESLMTLIKLGFSRILTSGQEKTAFLGRNLIKKLVLKVNELGSSLIILPGGGIDPSNLNEILEITGVKEFHGSARAEGTRGPADIWKTDTFIVKEMVRIAGTSK